MLGAVTVYSEIAVLAFTAELGCPYPEFATLEGEFLWCCRIFPVCYGHVFAILELAIVSNASPPTFVSPLVCPWFPQAASESNV